MNNKSEGEKVNKTIQIYTTNSCAYCLMVKRWLESKGLSWEEINVEENPERANEPFEMSGQLNVPVTVITDNEGNREVVVGYNLGKLAPAVA
jgi:glutaredoxin